MVSSALHKATANVAGTSRKAKLRGEKRKKRAAVAGGF
jgi:hypothetical protein